MSGTILTIAGTTHGQIMPAIGGAPLPFDQTDTVDDSAGHVEAINTKTLAQSLIGTSVTYVYDGAVGKARNVHFS